MVPRSQQPPRVFHVVYFRDVRVQLILDAIRFIANPSEKMQAHMTIGGPFRVRRNPPREFESLEGSCIRVIGQGTFFGPSQHTVFLEVEAPQLVEVANLQDYTFRPHVTLYDGDSHALAQALVGLLEWAPKDYKLEIGAPQMYETVRGQKRLALFERYAEAESTHGLTTPKKPASKWSLRERLILIRTLLVNLEDLASQPRN